MNDQAPQVSILIVSYNTRDMTLACIRSVVEQTTRTAYEIVVVDNDSPDGSADAIAAAFPQVNLIRSPDNLGFGRANNLAAEHARGDLLLLLNPDTVVLDGAIDRLVDFARAHPAARIWGGRTVFADRSLNPSSCWRFMTPWSVFAQAVGLTALWRDSDLFNREGYGGWARDSVREVEIVTGCFLLVERALWRDLGGFDERFFMYAEEADLCWRARRKGARPLVTPEATIVHYGGGSETVRSAKTIRLLSGKVTFFDKHWPPARRALGVGLFKLMVLVRLAAYGGAALVTRSERHGASAREWREVWQARRAWAGGYPS